MVIWLILLPAVGRLCVQLVLSMQYSRFNVVRIISEILAFAKGYSRDYVCVQYSNRERTTYVEHVSKELSSKLYTMFVTYYLVLL